MAELRGAVIGCGFFAVNHMHGWNDVQGARIVAICDRDPTRLNIVGEQFGIARRYADAAQMFAEGGFDFVDIATTVQSHLPLVKLAAQHKIPVICQKPFALNLDDAKDMVATCAAAGIPLMVHENFRWQSPLRAVRAVIDSGEIGAPFWGRFSFRTAYDIFSGQPYLAKGKRFIIEDLGVHTLDIARFYLGDVDALTARTAHINPAVVGEDAATMLLAHGNGATSIVDCSYTTLLSPDPFPETMVEIDGSEGTIRLGQGYKMDVASRKGTRHVDVSPLLLPWASRPWHNVQESVFAIQQHWIECLIAGVTPATSGADNLKTSALVEAAYQSAESGKVVKLKDLLN
jgi:D-apiose dehydrogenase